MNRRVVAVDGAAGSGKSTLARLLARRLGLPYVNTGSMYRAVAAAALRAGVDLDDATALVEVSRGLRFRLRDGSPPELEVEGYGTADLESFDVESTVSRVARHPDLRADLRDRQRRIGAPGAVVEGRDIGSVVFPDAAVKLYLVADPAVRAARRAEERHVADPRVAADLARRDREDAQTNPFVAPQGAVVLDTGAAGVDETLERALGAIAERAPWLLPEVTIDG